MFKRILIPTDGSEITAKAVQTVLAMAKQSGASVFINGEEARGQNGEFTRMVALNPGLNTLVFEAVDAAGNVIYNSLLVTRR